MIKVVIQEEQPDSTDGRPTYLITIHEATSENPEVIADFLRSVANKYDPPKPVTRSER